MAIYAYNRRIKNSGNSGGSGWGASSQISRVPTARANFTSGRVEGNMAKMAESLKPAGGRAENDLLLDKVGI